MPASTTEAIVHAITRALDKQQRSIDAACGLRALKIDVKLNQKTGKPRCVIITMETEREEQNTLV